MVGNVNGCDIEHEAIVDEGYSEEVMCAGWNPQLALAANSTAEQINKRAKDRKRTSAAQSSELEEVVDRIEFVRSTAFPQCP